MKSSGVTLRSLIALVSLIALAGCVAAPGPYYEVQQNPTYSDTPPYLTVGPNDFRYVIRIDDRTPFGVFNLPKTQETLYQKGFDQVRRDREADFSVDVGLAAAVTDNPEQRAAHTVGGALVGAATGAIIGGALGEPGSGAAIGAASGGALGLVAPAGKTLVRVDVTVYSFSDRTTSRTSKTIDLAHVPPQDVQYVIDNEVSRMVQTLPPRR